jgi:hypothetical protein
MTSPAATTRKGTPTPPPRPTRMELLKPMLEGTHRNGVPVRRAFLQTAKPGSDGSRAAKLARLTRDEKALDAYLLISALASSSEPYDTWFPASTWAQVARLDVAAEDDAAKAHWSKIVTKLATEKLIERKRVGNKMNYILLDEAGDGSPYARPVKLSDGAWFSIPHFYWTEEFDEQLTFPEKLMLLIALDQPDDFRMPTDQTKAWYGISESTSRRGFNGLVDRGILSQTSTQVADPKAPTGWKTVLRYTTLGPWALSARKTLMSTPRRSVTIEPAEEVATP